jgi:hypothetical protein
MAGGPCLPLDAQTRASSPPRLAPDLREIVRQAGTIFAGRVVSIEPLHLASSRPGRQRSNHLPGEQAIRGARAGEKLTFREWAGLWSGGERYRVGQRMMLLLYEPSALGLTSPVRGPAGRFAVDGGGGVVLSEAQRQAIRLRRVPVRIDTNKRIELRDLARALRRMGEE